MLFTLRMWAKIECTNGKDEVIEREKAQRLPGSAFDRHRAEIQQSEEEIKAYYTVDRNHRNVHNNDLFLFCLLDVCGQSIIRGNEKLFIEPHFSRRSSLDYARRSSLILWHIT